MCQHDIPRGRDPKQYITKRPRNAIKLGDRGASTYPPPPLKNALKSRSRFIGFRYQINGNAFLPPSIFFFSFFFYFRNSLDRDDSTFTRDFMAGISCPKGVLVDILSNFEYPAAGWQRCGCSKSGPRGITGRGGVLPRDRGTGEEKMMTKLRLLPRHRV